MDQNKIYFANKNFYNLIKQVGGVWNDKKERPLVCLLKIDDSNLFWAIPMGNFNHRNQQQQQRIKDYLSKDSKNIESCYYHVGNTNEKSIFFISRAVPITDKYIEREYKVGSSVYEIKNKKLINALIKKLKRILMYEDKRPDFFNQHITALKAYLLSESVNTK